MLDADPIEDDGTVFRDVITLALLGFVAIVILLLPHIHPPTQAAAEIKSPGSLVVEARWPDGLDADVDLWIEAPGDRPVGYSNKSGRAANLLRDDLGSVNDSTDLNYEVAYTRGLPPGDYTINLHLYSNRQQAPSIEVDLDVGLRKGSDGTVGKVASRSVRLLSVGQEETVVRLTIDDEGRVVPGSVHDLPRKLRARQ